MSELINVKRIKARKEHICDYCYEPIKKGEIYERSVNKNEETLFTWNAHIRCSEIAEGLWDWIDPDDGMSQDDFWYGSAEFCHTFICPDCEHFDIDSGDCDLDKSFCTDKMAEKLKTHELIRDRTCSYAWILQIRKDAEDEKNG